MSHLEESFIYLWEEFCPNTDLYREVRFAHPRRYRADFFHPASKIIIEIQGGTWSSRKMGHNSGRGIERDAEKIQMASVLGFFVFPIIDKHLVKEKLLEIEGAIVQRSATKKELVAYLGFVKESEEVRVFDSEKSVVRKVKFKTLDKKKERVDALLGKKPYSFRIEDIIPPPNWPKIFFNQQ